jgi:hypothetical protein
LLAANSPAGHPKSTILINSLSNVHPPAKMLAIFTSWLSRRAGSQILLLMMMKGQGG